MRKEELFSLRKIHVNIDRSFLQVIDSKTHEGRFVPLNETLKEILRRRLELPGEYVFSNARGGKLAVLTNAFWNAAERAGLIRWQGGKRVRFRFHDLRHSFGSRLGMQGVDLKSIMEIMGHKSAKVAMRYQHPSPDIPAPDREGMESIIMRFFVERGAFRGVIAIFCVLFFHLGTPAMAADWYLRAAIGYESSRSADFSDDNCASTNPPALFGCGPGIDGRPLGAYGDFGSFGAFEVALGRNVLPLLRTDLAVSWRPNMVYSGKANFLGVPGGQPVYSTASALTTMLNVFVDIPNPAAGSLSGFKPYLGGGLGVSRNSLDEMHYLFPGLAVHKISITPSGRSFHFAYTFSFGTGVVISERVSLDIAYRWSHLGRVETDAGRMYMNHVPKGIDIAGTSARLQTHGLQMGLRYSF